EKAMIKPKTVNVDDSLDHAVKVMRENRIDTIFITNKSQKLLGYLDIEDIKEGVRKNAELIDIMQRDIYRVNINSKLQDSVHTILKRNVRIVPVVDDYNKLVGLITRARIVDIVYDSNWGDVDQ